MFGKIPFEFGCAAEFVGNPSEKTISDFIYELVPEFISSFSDSGRINPSIELSKTAWVKYPIPKLIPTATTKNMALSRATFSVFIFLLLILVG
jgi:hypothetical protein